jgi:hypothetical protein
VLQRTCVDNNGAIAIGKSKGATSGNTWTIAAGSKANALDNLISSPMVNRAVNALDGTQGAHVGLLTAFRIVDIRHGD